MQQQIPLTQDLVLIGGGHAHALVLRKWGMRPLPGVRLTVINPGATAPYTGMLPGHIAGHYTQAELEIDLVRLCRFAGARMIDGHATDLDPSAKTVTVSGHGVIPYDVASLDIGITADLPDLPGFSQHGIGAKPLHRYAQVWRQFLAQALATDTPTAVCVIGGGVAGVELALAMAYALRPVPQAKVSVIEAADDLTGTAAASRALLRHKLSAAGIDLHLKAQIQEITSQQVILQNGRQIPANLVVSAAGARPQDWLSTTGLPLHQGYVCVEPTLQVHSHPALFAVGDCAHLTDTPRPKAGVFAVRAAPVLYDNLIAGLSGGKLRRFTPQRRYLKLVSLGERSALAEKYQIPFSGPLLWRWKDHIDQKFMAKFQDYPEMPQPALPKSLATGVTAELGDGKPLCAGCGAKVGPAALNAIVAALPHPQRPDILRGAGDDAATLQIGGQKQVITTDHLRAFTEDPALMARITAVHALGDIWAMGAAPQAALAQIILPRMSSTLQSRMLSEIMRHAGDVFAQAGAEIIGGHTTLGSELTLGFTVTGLVSDPITLAGGRPGDVLILTRPLGSGTLLAGEMQGKANGRDVMAMLHKMSQPQGDTARILHGAHAMTDVTGFGLAGHLHAICRASNTGARIWLEAMPFYDGALELSELGIRSTLFPANLADAPLVNAKGAAGALLHDPQTAGGMLAALAPDHAEGVVDTLLQHGIGAVKIGVLTDQQGEVICT